MNGVPAGRGWGKRKVINKHKLTDERTIDAIIHDGTEHDDSYNRTFTEVI